MTERQPSQQIAKRDGWSTLPERYAVQLRNRPDECTKLVPLEDLGPLIQVLEHRLQPATPKELAAALGMITAAWPNYDKLQPEIAAAHLRMLRTDLSAFPADVLAKTIEELRRRLRFVPAIAEFFQLATELSNPDRQRLRNAREHVAEHERREAEAKAAAEKEAEWQRALQARIEALATRYGPEWPDCTPREFELAGEAMIWAGMSILAAWKNALEAVEPWIIQVLPRACQAGRAFNLLKDRKISPAEASELIHRIRVGTTAAASELLDAIEAGTAGAWSNQDPTIVWEHSEREWTDFVFDVRHGHVKLAAA